MISRIVWALMVMGLFVSNSNGQDPETGVSWELAKLRKASIRNVEYDLRFKLQAVGPIHSELNVRFDQVGPTKSIVLDFNVPSANVRTVSRVEGADVKALTDFRVINGHIVIPTSELAKDQERHEIRIEFIAGNQSLNRNEKFLYTLLVPDRASTVFPCFDQPDLKAKFGLTLELPKGWIASANGKLESRKKLEGGRSVCSYRRTKPISTYLFAFAAGEFQTIRREINGRTVTMLHRESDEEKVAKNVDAIFKTHAFALNWLEDYTAIDYPFDKFDFVLIPSFQYGGMEHIGNIFYNADQLFLDDSATKNQKLNRASLIAHETAHMWFGNLVTMKWFDDVWLKEVFANFMAAKIVNPSFPDINHDLGFLMKHHPSAYDEDRSKGSYPIQQKLGNLRNAGMLYGRIIYQKAPVVMRQLETMIGAETLQAGLQEYLDEFRYDNAVWDDLIDILDKRSEIDLKSWSNTWVKNPGTPEVSSEIVGQSAKKLVLRQTRKASSGQYWSQKLDVRVVKNGKIIFEERATIGLEETVVNLPETLTTYDFYLANGSELGYGYFQLDQQSKKFLLKNINSIEDDVLRGAARMALYESLVRGGEGAVQPTELISALAEGVVRESEPLNRQRILAQLNTVFWKFLSPEKRSASTNNIESALWAQIESEGVEKDALAAYFKSLIAVASSNQTMDRLYTIWESGSDVNGLTLSESDLITLAYELAIRLPDRADEILKVQGKRIKNEDRRKRFEYVIPALSPDQSTRDTFFERLRKAENRRPERWALEALHYLHHPLRAQASEKYLLPSLELLEEIQLTGDIFFPKRWLVETFSGHRSASAANVVNEFLNKRPEYPYRLRNKILQAADLLFVVSGQR